MNGANKRKRNEKKKITIISFHKKVSTNSTQNDFKCWNILSWKALKMYSTFRFTSSVFVLIQCVINFVIKKNCERVYLFPKNNLFNFQSAPESESVFAQISILLPQKNFVEMLTENIKCVHVLSGTSNANEFLIWKASAK